MKKIIHHTQNAVRKTGRRIVKIAAGNTLKDKKQRQRADARKALRDRSIGRFCTSLDKCAGAVHPKMEKEALFPLLMGLASTSRAMHRHHFRIHKPELRSQLYATVENILNIKALNEIKWKNYYPMCHVNPDIATLWRIYPERFDLHDERHMAKMIDLMPKDALQKSQLSKTGRIYIGAAIPEQGSFPVAVHSRRDISYICGDFILSRKRMIQHIAAEYPDQPVILEKWQAFMDNAHEKLSCRNNGQKATGIKKHSGPAP